MRFNRVLCRGRTSFDHRTARPVDVRFGSKADMAPLDCDVRFTPRKRTSIVAFSVPLLVRADEVIE